MITIDSSSRLRTNLITTALLTVFITSFGVFANVQIENRIANCALQQNRTHNEEYCSTAPMKASIESSDSTMLCRCPIEMTLAYK